ncbi:hypothetical protein C0992_008545 [Termitomyces sp. T32_za158]|nr:hypothetical protein C0992_008545 [Termitomyces sp. T32_za158]
MVSGDHHFIRYIDCFLIFFIESTIQQVVTDLPDKVTKNTTKPDPTSTCLLASPSNTDLSHVSSQMDLPSSDVSSGAKIMNGLQTTWTGVELLLNKLEKLLTGTTLQIPVAVLNTLIEFKNAVADNNKELNAHIVQITDRLGIVNKELYKINDNVSRELVKEFSEKLIHSVIELVNISKKATWKKIMENEKDKAQINSIFKDIDEQTKDFHMKLVLKIDQDVHSLHESFLMKLKEIKG